MRNCPSVRLSLAALLLLSVQLAAQEVPFQQHENVVYAESHGIGLLMDVFVPTGTKNGLGIVDVVSGAWSSDRGKIRDHALAQTFHILCRKGFTVFAIRPGSVSKFSVPEMRSNLNLGIRWVKDHAAEYEIDPARLGLMGASAGGHLACLAAVTAEDGSRKDAKGSRIKETQVKAVAVFFPPTDFLKWGDKPVDPNGADRIGQLLRRLAVSDDKGETTPADFEQLVTQISPARLVTAKAPPFLLIHGDADPVVPLQQSETMVEALKQAGVPAELVIKKGGGHPWLTMHEEVQLLADWFERKLGEQ